MSNPVSSRPDRRLGAELPDGVVLRSYPKYAQAEEAANLLVAAEVPPRAIAIVGSELKSVERVVGRRSYGRAALNGAMIGGWLGLLFGGTQVAFAGESLAGAAVGTTLLAILLFSAAIGVLGGVLLFALNRRAKGYTSVSYIVAGAYELTVAAEHQAKAREALGSPAG